MPIDVEPLTLAGQVVVWGDDSHHQVRDTPPGKFKALAPGGAGQSLAIDEDGALVLWGGVGASGDVPELPSDSGSGVSPVHGLIRGGFVNAALGRTHLIAVRQDGSIFQWGDYLGTAMGNLPNNLLAIAAAAGAAADVVIGIDDTLTKLGTMADPPSGTFTKVRARSNYAIALSRTGRLFGWGGDLFKNLTGWTSDGAGHFYVDGPFTDIAAGIVQKDPGSPAWPHVLALHASFEAGPDAAR
jgi:hypothetical protein